MTQAEIDAAVAEAKAKYPWLSQVIAGCLVGWPEEANPLVYAALMVKVSEAISEQFDGRDDARNA